MTRQPLTISWKSTDDRDLFYSLVQVNGFVYMRGKVAEKSIQVNDYAGRAMNRLLMAQAKDLEVSAFEEPIE